MYCNHVFASGDHATSGDMATNVVNCTEVICSGDITSDNDISAAHDVTCQHLITTTGTSSYLQSTDANIGTLTSTTVNATTMSMVNAGISHGINLNGLQLTASLNGELKI